MKVLTPPIYDKKIKSFNIIVEMTLKEYYEFIKNSMLDNEFQRKRVKSSRSIYALLKQDIMAGCIIPPIVLALNNTDNTINDKTELSDIEAIIRKNQNNIFILDGLQRTFTIEEIYNEKKSSLFDEKLLLQPVRVEIYLGLKKEGVLYRMLTLNTGQTPMSLRHQIEIVYSNLINDNSNDSIFKLVKETESVQIHKLGIYKFNDAVDAFTSFLENDYLQITREKILDTVKSFEKLIKLKDDVEVFKELMILYTLFVKKADESINGRDIAAEISTDVQNNIFGKDAFSIFNKSQPMTGFGAAISRLLELESYSTIQEIKDTIETINVDDLYTGLIGMLTNLDDIRRFSKKIGNAQRCFFYHLFKIYLDKNGEYYLSFTSSVKQAKQAYDRDN